MKLSIHLKIMQFLMAQQKDRDDTDEGEEMDDADD